MDEAKKLNRRPIRLRKCLFDGVSMDEAKKDEQAPINIHFLLLQMRLYKPIKTISTYRSGELAVRNRYLVHWPSTW